MPRDLPFHTAAAAYLLAYKAAFCSAAALLGGAAAEARTQRLLDEVSLGSPMTRRLIRELDALEDLLALRHVHDFGRIEAECFAAIDPMDPVVEEICFLLDGLREARRLSAIAAA